jgi:DNA-binding Lrp family transcriptional regulator
MARRHQLADHCLVLLQYCASHQTERQTQTSLSKATGIPQTEISRIIREARSDRYGALLCRVACKYRFDFELSTKDNRILDAVYVGYG